MNEHVDSPMRLDRLLTLGLIAPLRAHVAPGRGRIPILMYHSISRHTDPAPHPYFRTVTTPRRFRSHMAFLRDQGYRVMTLTRALQLMRSATEADLSAQGHPVVVTFDDGFRDFFTEAFPTLERLNMPSTVFLASGCLNGQFVNGQDCLRKTEVRELAAHGVEFGSHTVTHPQLATVDEPTLHQELAVSRQEIQELTGSDVTLFSYPYRFPEEDSAFTTRLEAALRTHGYVGGVTTRIGRGTPHENELFLKRIPVNDDDDIPLFKAKLEGAYDWLHGAQLMRKHMRKLMHRSAA